MIIVFALILVTLLAAKFIKHDVLYYLFQFISFLCLSGYYYINCSSGLPQEVVFSFLIFYIIMVRTFSVDAILSITLAGFLLNYHGLAGSFVAIYVYYLAHKNIDYKINLVIISLMVLSYFDTIYSLPFHVFNLLYVVGVFYLYLNTFNQIEKTKRMEIPICNIFSLVLILYNARFGLPKEVVILYLNTIIFGLIFLIFYQRKTGKTLYHGFFGSLILLVFTEYMILLLPISIMLILYIKNRIKLKILVSWWNDFVKGMIFLFVLFLLVGVSWEEIDLLTCFSIYLFSLLSLWQFVDIKNTSVLQEVDKC